MWAPSEGELMVFIKKNYIPYAGHILLTLSRMNLMLTVGLGEE
jgi:hypothetical protein